MIILVADAAAVNRASAVLRAGRLVAFPTETVYGLGADATDPAALAAIFAAKGRPVNHPLIVHLSDASELDRWGRDIPPSAHLLAEAFWPGPLTLVLGRGENISLAATGGRASVGLRVPDHPVALALLRATGRPVAAPSANRFGRVSPTTAAHVAAEFAAGAVGGHGAIGPEIILDGGSCRVGVESTIVELTGSEPTLLRPGGVSAQAIEAVLGRALHPASGPSRASGMLASHYAPQTALEVVGASEVLAAVVAHQAGGRRVVVLGASSDLAASLVSAGIVSAGIVSSGIVAAMVLEPVDSTEQYAQVLYRRLREADELGVDCILAVAPAAAGLGQAIADRLAKAAAPRP